jgi:hypothetical protein
MTSRFFCLFAFCFSACAAAATPDTGAAPAVGGQASEVDITAKFDSRKLEREIIPRFIDLHALPNARQEQIGRWFVSICPETQGLKSKEDEFVTKRILEIAARVGAPAATSSECQTDVDIVFTSDPQQQIDYLAHQNADILGFHYAAQRKKITTIAHPIQAWYVTGTRSRAGGNHANSGATLILDGLVMDSPNSLAAAGQAGSRLGDQRRTEFMRVTVIVDAEAMARYPLSVVSDYVAMLVLSRAGQDQCNELQSILDLLASCAESKPASLTVADEAFLKALYKSGLDSFLNRERGEIHEWMVRGIVSK